MTDKKDISNIIQFFQQTSSLYIADGHHRLASSSSYNESSALDNPCLAYLVSSDQLALESFHRVIKKSKKEEKKILLDLIKINKQIIVPKTILPIKKNEIKI